MHNYFYHTGVKSNYVDLLHELSVHGHWHYDEKSLIHAQPVPDIYLDDYLLKIKKRFKGVPLLFRLPGMTFYGWHIDRLRKCCINLELNDTLSSTYFGTKNDREIYTNLFKLNYDSQYVLLNTQEYHSVANLGFDRIIFTLGFNFNDYDEVKSYLKDK